MTFLIADSFTRSLAVLTPDEQSAVKTTAFDLQQDRTRASMRYHALNKAKDPRFASVRVNDDLRVIVHRTPQSMLLCYVGHHDDAYRWAERRKLEAHPSTGAMQMVEVRERVEEVVKRIVVPEAVEAAPTEEPLFTHLGDDALLGYGVPPEWIADARTVTESGLFDLAEHLPAEAVDALLSLAVGELPEVVPPSPEIEDPFQHPAAKRRFRVVEGVQELERALEAPWEQWAVFLHPTQQELVTRDYNGPARVSGSAGTGKTVVALHRTVHLAERSDYARVLLTTFSYELAVHLEDKLYVLTRNRPRLRERIELDTLAGLAGRLHRARFGEAASIVDRATLRTLLTTGAREADAAFSESFLLSEWDHVVDAWQLRTWEAYRTVARIGRKIRLPESARERAWGVFERVWSALDSRGLTTEAAVYNRLAADFAASDGAPYDHVVLDEARDASAAQLLFLARLVGDRPNGLFFTGDLGQRIFQQPFSWRSVGVDVRGRARTLKVNYRTSHQIRSCADRLLDERTDDVDGETQERRGTINVFDGPAPSIDVFETASEEQAAGAAWLEERISAGVSPSEIALFVRSEAELPRAIATAERAGVPAIVLDTTTPRTPGTDAIAVATMHLAKGLEFRAVAVMACDEEIIPSADRLSRAADMVELQEIHETERHLLYVAATRARDRLRISGVAPGSEFLSDLTSPSRRSETTPTPVRP